MAEINARLRRALDGPAPQHKVDGKDSFEFTEGSDGAQHIKIVDVDGTPLSVIPTKNSAVESRLDSIENKLDSVIENGVINTQVSGSNVEDKNAVPTRNVAKQEMETVLDSYTIDSGEDTGNQYLHPNGASEVYLFIQIDQKGWSLDYRNQFGSVSPQNGFPQLRNVDEVFTRAYPAISFPVGYHPNQGIPSPSNLKEAKDWGIPITTSEYFKIRNGSDEPATVTVNTLRVWR